MRLQEVNPSRQCDCHKHRYVYNGDAPCRALLTDRPSGGSRDCSYRIAIGCDTRPRFLSRGVERSLRRNRIPVSLHTVAVVGIFKSPRDTARDSITSAQFIVASINANDTYGGGCANDSSERRKEVYRRRRDTSRRPVCEKWSCHVSPMTQ